MSAFEESEGFAAVEDITMGGLGIRLERYDTSGGTEKE